MGHPGTVQASARRCGYSQFGARIVIFHASTVVVSVNMVLLLVKLFSLYFRSGRSRALDDE